MAIYGMNFNHTEIPPTIRARFPSRIRIKDHTPAVVGKYWPDAAMRERHPAAFLGGVATHPEERDHMIEQATNSNRTIFVIERKIGMLNVTGYGIYIW